jgi:spermidine synthase
MAGFVTMAFEIAGARVLGPYFGSSVFVWTSLIGMIMGSLSLGYWLGGLLSVRRSDYGLLMLILALSAFFVLLTAVGNIYILDRVVKYVPGIRWQTVVSVAILFGPASTGLGMVLPYGVKLQVKKVESSGGTVGNLYALSSVGSILGTFLAGFVLVPLLGFAQVLFMLASSLVLIAASILAVKRPALPLVLTALAGGLIMWAWIHEAKKTRDYVDADTRYNRVIIYDTQEEETGRPIRMLRVNDENSSAMYLDGEDDLVFEVLKYYRLMEHFVPGFRTAMMIGGSGYAFPKDYLKRYPEASLDVVEIDPGLTALAREYFDLPDDPRLTIYHEDGRTFLNSNRKTYDAILMDAYKSMITIPYQLTTQEAVQAIFDGLEPNGAVFANIIASLDPENNQFLMAELATYRSVFPRVLLFAVQYPDPTAEERKHFQNLMLVGLKADEEVKLTSGDPEMSGYLSHYLPLDPSPDAVILTDEYAPVEFYASKALK